MRRYITRTLALALAFTLALALLPAGALALGETFSAVNEGKAIWYRVTSDNPATVEVTAHPTNPVNNKYTGDIVIPATATNAATGTTYQVTAIGESAFNNCDSLSSVIIPEGVTAIGKRAFNDCATLNSVVIPEGVTTIGVEAFWGCDSLQNASLPSSLLSIEEMAFYDCDKLSAIALPAGLKTLGKSAFSESDGFTAITIPGSVQVIGDNAFQYCRALQRVTLEPGVETIGEHAFMGCGALLDITIPITVTSIKPSAFAGCKELQSVALPDGLKTLGEEAFAMAEEAPGKLSDVTLPDSLTSIGPEAFRFCLQLSGVTLRVSGNTAVDNGGFTREGSVRVGLPDKKLVTKVVLLPGGRVTNNTGGTLAVVMNGREYALADGQTMAYSAPAAASYGPTLYSLRVEGGTGTGSYPAGQAVTIRANDGAPFTQWVLASGVGTIGDPFSRETTFTMGNGGAVVTALNAAPPKTGDGPALWLGLALVTLAAGAYGLAMKKRGA